VNRIAVIHMGALGDLVQILPTLRAIRVKWPAAHITLIGRPERAAIAQVAGLADACRDFDSPASRAAAAEVELVVDFVAPHQPPEQASGPRVIVVEPLPPAGWTEPAPAWVFRETSARLDLPRVSLTPEVPVPPPLVEAARRFLESRSVRGSYAVIHPGSGSRKKNWPADRFAEIARRLRGDSGRTVVWLLGPAEIERGLAGEGATGERRGAGETGLPGCGFAGTVFSNLPLDLVAGILSQADLYLGNDSGVTHLAAAVRDAGGRATPTVALFGPSDVRLWAPRGPQVRIVQSPDGTMDAMAVDRVWREIVAVQPGGK